MSTDSTLTLSPGPSTPSPPPPPVPPKDSHKSKPLPPPPAEPASDSSLPSPTPTPSPARGRPEEASSSSSSPAPTPIPTPTSAPKGGDGKRGHHRRASSSHRVKETLDAVATRGPEGRRTVNQYTLGPQLGKGAFGTVELGVDLQTGEKYAVKEYSKARLRKQVRQRSMADARGQRGRGGAGSTVMRELESEADKNPISLIAREVAIMKKLDHPNLVHLYEVLDVPLSDSIFMVLEYCPGGILLDLPPPSTSPDSLPIPMDLAIARTYFGQILMGLEYLHENDVVHRDIKPENILLTVDKQTAKMCDFGVSEMFARKGDDRVKKGMGSPAFMSPESVEGGQEMGAKMADVWALGVTLYCMLTGHLPFTQDNPLELFEAIKTEEIKIPSDWPEHQKSVIQGMLDRNVEARLTVDGIRNHPWMSEAELPSKEDNLSEDRMVREPTPEEIKKAVRSVSSAFAVIRAVQKFKRLTASKRSSRTSSIDSSVFSMSPHASPLLPTTPLSPPLNHNQSSPFAPGHQSRKSTSASSVASTSYLAPPPSQGEEMIADEISDEPATFDEPEEVEKPQQFDEPQEVMEPQEVDDEPQQYAEPQEVDEPEEDESLFSSPSNGSNSIAGPSRQPSSNLSVTTSPSAAGIADDLSDEPASMEDEEEEQPESQETIKPTSKVMVEPRRPERPKLGLEVPSGLSERFGKMGCVIVESPGGGREEIG